MKKPSVVLLIAFVWPHLALWSGAAELVPAVNVKEVNTEADEDEPFVTRAGQAQTIYFSRKSKDKFDILMIQRANGLAPWSKAQDLGKFVRTEVDDRGTFATPEGQFPQYLYYATKKDKETNNFDIYAAVKQNRKAVFTEPTPIQMTATEDDEMHPWLSGDGKELWFSRKTPEGWRVFICKRAEAAGAQGFEAAELVKELPPEFCHATLTRDGKTMYLQGPVEAGQKRLGLFVAFKTAKGWGQPRPLTMLNHSQGERGSCSPALNSGGDTLYFASDRPGGKGGLDIWSVPTVLLKVKR